MDVVMSTSEPLEGGGLQVPMLTDVYSCDSMHADMRLFQKQVADCCQREKTVISQFEKVPTTTFCLEPVYNPPFCFQHGAGPDDWKDLQDSLHGIINLYDMLAEDANLLSDSDGGDRSESGGEDY